LLNIDEILIDRADAYRLHKREKEASNYLRRSHERLPGEHLARSGLLWSWRLTGFGIEESAIRNTNHPPALACGCSFPKPVHSERLARRARSYSTSRMSNDAIIPTSFPLGRPSYRNLLVVHSRHSSGEPFVCFNALFRYPVSHSLSTRHAASIPGISKNTNQRRASLSCAQRRTVAKGLQSVIVVSLRRSTPHPY
jgi:hypothetical protein